MKRFWSNVACGLVTILIILFCVDLANDSIIIAMLIESYEVIGSLIVIVGTFFFLSGIILSNQLKKLLKQTVSFTEEDQLNEKQDKMFADAALCFRFSMVLFLFVVATGFILLRDSNPEVVFVALCFLGISFVLSKVLLYDLTKKRYPEREISLETEEDNVLDILDDGEKYIVLQAYDKVFRIINPLLFVAIMTASIYSAFSGESQIFSILFMTALLITIDTVYLLNVRSK